MANMAAAGNSDGSTRQSEENGDRLSDLPDNILHHILSFLNTNHIVQTSVLSRRWRSQWGNVHALNFHAPHHRHIRQAKFREHVVQFLSRRGGPDDSSAAVSSVTIDVTNTVWELETDLFDTVMKYARTNLRRLGVHGSNLATFLYADFEKLAASLTAHGHHESLEALELARCSLQDGDAFGSVGFISLTNLELRGCTFSSCCDPFVGIPRLNRLKLDSCSLSRCSLKISGLELLSLEISGVYSVRGIDVVAPKLKSFVFHGYSAECLENLELPSLDRAVVRVCWGDHRRGPDTAALIQKNEEYMKQLRGLRNAKSLALRFDKIYYWKWKEHEFPFNNMKSAMESEASPFTRLKILRVEYPQDPQPIALHDHVIRYFFERSSNAEEKIVKFEKGKNVLNNAPYVVKLVAPELRNLSFFHSFETMN
ncbi:unnamed protein product [Linum tenue]|uniref:F-box domain-containing protein n=1 Tax=Linum tenue TaxID=586396 RepID=A0AAV0GNI6_9ROSI|nr:unnamed protein product [Linum tenue]